LLDPGVDGAEGFGIEVVDAVAAFPVLADEVGTTEKTEVLGDRGPRDGKGAGNLAGGLAAPTKQVENGAAGGIGQCLEGGFGVSRGRICNRTVTLNA
jgi:hypothetical protein